MFLINSRLGLVSAASQGLRTHGPSPFLAPLLPKLRGQFAEFLNHGSLDRLGILYLTTCVGLGYGRCTHSLEAFLGSIGSPTSPETARHRISGIQRTDLPARRPTSLPRDYHRPGWATFLRHPIACLLPVRVTRSTDPPRKASRRQALSITGFSRGAYAPVREYQPVVHRLRLSASS